MLAPMAQLRAVVLWIDVRGITKNPDVPVAECSSGSGSIKLHGRK
jgi:hypothetical protein